MREMFICWFLCISLFTLYLLLSWNILGYRIFIDYQPSCDRVSSPSVVCMMHRPNQCFCAPATTTVFASMIYHRKYLHPFECVCVFFFYQIVPSNSYSCTPGTFIWLQFILPLVPVSLGTSLCSFYIYLGWAERLLSFMLFRFAERGKIFSKEEVRSIQIGPGGLFFTGDGSGELKVWNWLATEQSSAWCDHSLDFKPATVLPLLLFFLLFPFFFLWWGDF